jgi:tetratricopeptide (TPR) repeat protein
MLFFLRLLCVLLGVWYILLGIGLLIGWNLNPAPGVGLFNLIFFSFIFCGVGLAGFRNWARIGITIFSILLVVLLISGQHISFVESPLFFAMLLLPVVYINIKKVRKNFEGGKEVGTSFQKISWVKTVIIFILVAIALACLFLFLFYNPQRHLDRGDIYFRSGKFDQAITEYSVAIRQEPQLRAVYSQRALAYVSKGDYASAIADYTKQVDSFLVDSSDPYFNRQKAEAVLNRAEVYFLKGEYADAWDDVHKAESLGGKARMEFIERLSEASNGDK